MPEADKKRIRDRLSAAKDKRLEEYDTYFRNSPYKVIYGFFKEHGTVRRSHEWQYGASHDIDFSCKVELEVPKKDRTLSKKTVEIYAGGWYTADPGRTTADPYY